MMLDVDRRAPCPGPMRRMKTIVKSTNGDRMLAATMPSDETRSLQTEVAPIEICGVVLLQVDPQIYLRRQATLEIMMAAKWQGQGLGKALMMAALELADMELMLERIEVEIAIDNLSALKLCKSLGFKVEGTARDWALTADGEYIDAYLLARCRSNGMKVPNNNG